MAGKSQRFYDAGYNLPKGLIEFFGLPMVGHILKVFEKFNDVLIIVNEKDFHEFNLKELFADLHPNVKIAQIKQHSLGPSYSIIQAMEFIELKKKIIVHYCDFSGVWDPWETVNLLNKFDGVLLSFTGFHPTRINGTKFAYAKVNSENNLLAIKEKGSFSLNPEKENASSGVYAFSSGALMLNAIKEQIEMNLHINGEFYTSLTFEALLIKNKSIHIQNMKWFFGWGTPEDLENYIYYLKICESILNIEKCNFVIEHNAIILAAGKSSRLRLAGERPKQSKFILNRLKLIDFSKNLVAKNENTFLVATNEIYSVNVWGLPIENLKILTHASESQISSVQIGLSMIKNKKIPITFLASDNIVKIDKKIFDDLITNGADIIVWTHCNYPFAKVFPDQYSWVKINDDNIIEQGVYKKAPKDLRNWKLITGNFTFRNFSVINDLINGLENRLGKIDREPILDDLVEIALEMGFNIRAFDLVDYLTLGSDLENKVFDYFSEIYLDAH
jgi:dTDP-glucose pyrophosphorylase